MKVLYVGPSSCAESVAAFFASEEISVTCCPLIREAITAHERSGGSYFCMILHDLAVVRNEADLLKTFLSYASNLPVVFLGKEKHRKSKLLLISQMERVNDGFRILLRRFSKLSALSGSYCINAGEELILEYRRN